MVALAALAGLSACATKLGPRTVPVNRFNYNEAIARSLNEQLLLNLVRLRYRDTPMFIDVGSVISQYSFSASASASPTIKIDGGKSNEYGLGVGGSYTENPTITYEPLRGGAAAKRLLSPIDPATLALLSQSGWSIERLLVCCVQEVNGIPNALAATGPAPTRLPDNARFRRLAELMRELQTQDRLRFRPIYQRTEDNTQQQVGVTLSFGDEDDATARELAEILRLPDGERTFRLVTQVPKANADEIGVSGRSLLGVLFFLSLAVDAPQEHRQAGLIGGADLDWQTVIGGLLRIQNATAAPEDAFVRIQYRGRWFYIGDSDLNSKTTFNLLNYLYSLQAAGAEGASPLLTVGVGR
ncbi:MAG: hypothetical protein GC160_03330 [Acidobacteria bacterium]|nr:hypothetical protein [Acidobacteriota bacterium]